jgi:tRNA(Ile)-lysidine synthase
MQDISASHLNMIDHIILSENASAKVNLPGCYEMSVSYDNAVAYVRRDGEIQDFTERPELSNNSFNNSFEPNFKIKILNIDEYDTEKYDAGRTSEQRHTAAFDYGRLKEAAQNAEGAVEWAITVRSREPGDYFTPQGMKSGKKKIQDYFVDRKIPKENRDYYKLAALGKEILWVFDPLYHKHNEINEKYKITGDTKRVLVLEIERKL